MGTVYRRGNKLWIAFKDQEGRRAWKSTYLSVGEEKKAEKMLDALERKSEALRDFTAEANVPLTVSVYFERWIKERRDRGVGEVDRDEGRVRKFALPTLGETLLADVRPKQVRQLVEALRKKVGTGKDDLAPRTVRHVYALLHRMFGDAVADELIDANPCVVKRGELPPKIDKNPAWRSTAIFTREEVEAVISDERTPWDRRVVYSLLFLGGLRFGEAAALRWRSYDPRAEPLGRLSVHASFDTKRRKVKSTKTERPREVPVHPTLANVLAQWKLGGFRAYFDNDPTPDDLIIPSRTGRPRDVNLALKRFHQDLSRIGLRPRRQHDARRTFITLALADGARKDVLRWVTHGPEGDIVDLYTTIPWKTLCEEVAKLKISLREGKVIALPKASNSGGAGSRSVTASVTVAGATKKARGLNDLGPSVQRRGWDSNPRYPFEYARFPSVSLQPLGHLSITPAKRPLLDVPQLLA
jgi:integrase